VARNSDFAQYETNEGPCFSSFREQRTLMIHDLQTDERWPNYRVKALELGVRSMMSVRLFVTTYNMGALDLYSRQPHAFGERQQVIAQVFATHASVAVKAALLEAGLNASIRSRDVIGQAKGIIMARLHMTDKLAFDMLVRISQDRNVPVREVAQEIARTGQISGLLDSSGHRAGPEPARRARDHARQLDLRPRQTDSPARR
jgi:hypothetical protein